MNYNKYCALTFNGKLLDELIPQYLTLNVDGRGATVRDIKTIDIDGRDGGLIQNANYKSKIITVYFLIMAENDKKYRETLDKLSLELNTISNVSFSFGDEEGYRIGRVSKINNPPYDTNQGIGSFEIYCEYPYKIVGIKTFSAGTRNTINYSDVYKLEYESFTIIPSVTEEIRIRNSTTGEVISIKNLDNTNEIVITKDSIKQGANDIRNKLDHTISTWKNFKLRNGDVLQYIGTSNVSVRVRGLMP